jgi:anti-anti-sigma factor
MYKEYIKEELGNIIIEKINLSRATLKEAGDFKRILIGEIESGSRKFIIDVSECEFIDSTFLGVLVIAMKKITSLGGSIKLVGFQAPVHSMFELTRAYKVFESYKSVEEAVESFS